MTFYKATDSMYVSRSTWSDNIDDAKIFSTKGAATRSANDNGQHDFSVKEVIIKVKE